MPKRVYCLVALDAFDLIIFVGVVVGLVGVFLHGFRPLGGPIVAMTWLVCVLHAWVCVHMHVFARAHANASVWGGLVVQMGVWEGKNARKTLNPKNLRIPNNKLQRISKA